MPNLNRELKASARALSSALKLERPLVFIDLETTGNNAATARVVEVAALKLTVDGKVDLRTRLVNPGTQIDPGATRVHGISDDDVRQAPEFRRIARSLSNFLDGCDLAGFGLARFDLRVLDAEFRRSGISFNLDDRRVVDALAIFFMREPRSLGAALRFYCDKESTGLHRAAADVVASLEVLLGQFRRYPDLPTDMLELDRLSEVIRPDPDWVDPEGLLVSSGTEVRVNFGKHRGRRLSEVVRDAPDYVEWLLKADFSDEVKNVIRSTPAAAEDLRG